MKFAAAFMFFSLGLGAQPRVYLLDAKILASKKGVLSDPIVALARQEADRLMNDGPFTITTRERLAPSGDKHDYMSQAPYFWRNPDTPNGLPYIRKDGVRNPEINKIPDHTLMDKVARDSRLLALAYYLTGEENYAIRAALLLRTWFLDSKTLMNPNLNYAQAVPGVNDGRGIGIIESRGLTSVIDAAGLLAGSRTWTGADQKGLEQWFAHFLAWLQDSKNGRDESNAENNHGTFYDVQVADFAFFTGQRDLAARTAETVKTKRIAAQIEPDGRQPKETDRTRGLSYSVMNLDGLMKLATLADHAGVDLWHFQTSDGRGIRRALDWLVPYFADEKKWQYQQIDTNNPAEFAPLLLRAAAVYHDQRYEALATRILGGEGDLEMLLLRASLKN